MDRPCHKDDASDLVLPLGVIWFCLKVSGDTCIAEDRTAAQAVGGPQSQIGRDRDAGIKMSISSNKIQWLR